MDCFVVGGFGVCKRESWSRVSVLYRSERKKKEDVEEGGDRF